MSYNEEGDVTMDCENCFCIYQYRGRCRLDSIEMDIQGKCKECVYIDMDEATLDSIKERSRW